MIRNYLSAQKQTQERSHDGRGSIDLYEIWEMCDFASDVDFIDRVVLPPSSTIGYHQHGNNEEMYVVLDGQGTMTLEGEQVAVKKGDMILNPAFGAHGLINDSDSDIDLLIIQVRVRDPQR